MYADLLSIQSLNTGDILTAATMTQVRNNDEAHEDPPTASVYHNALVSVTNATPTILLANSENHDNDSIHSTTVNTSRLTIQRAGRYLLFATVLFAVSSTGYRIIRFRTNGVTSYDVQATAASPTSSTVLSAVKTLVFAAGDYVEVSVEQGSGGALNAQLLEFVCIRLTR